MSFTELVAWAWRETPPVHLNRGNLIIHIFAVPLFVIGHVLILLGIFVHLLLPVAGIGCIVVSLVLQGFGHSLEKQQVPPFDGAVDFFRRLYAEQFCNYWRFLFSGQWYANYRSLGKNDAGNKL